MSTKTAATNAIMFNEYGRKRLTLHLNNDAYSCEDLAHLEEEIAAAIVDAGGVITADVKTAANNAFAGTVAALEEAAAAECLSIADHEVTLTVDWDGEDGWENFDLSQTFTAPDADLAVTVEDPEYPHDCGYAEEKIAAAIENAGPVTVAGLTPAQYDAAANEFDRLMGIPDGAPRVVTLTVTIKGREELTRSYDCA